MSAQFNGYNPFAEQMAAEAKTRERTERVAELLDEAPNICWRMVPSSLLSPEETELEQRWPILGHPQAHRVQGVFFDADAKESAVQQALTRVIATMVNVSGLELYDQTPGSEVQRYKNDDLSWIVIRDYDRVNHNMWLHVALQQLHNEGSFLTCIGIGADAFFHEMVNARQQDGKRKFHITTLSEEKRIPTGLYHYM